MKAAEQRRGEKFKPGTRMAISLAIRDREQECRDKGMSGPQALKYLRSLDPVQRANLIQLAMPHVELVVDVFMRSDSRFEQVFLTANKRPYRPVFRKLAVPPGGATTPLP